MRKSRRLPRLPDQSEAIEGATVASATAVRLLSGADLLAGGGSYGPARSLAVLALEESVKARTLGAIAAHGRYADFSDDSLRKIVYGDHKERHKAGLLQHAASAHRIVYGKRLFGMSVSADEQARIGDLERLLADANSAKQAGFYSDFDPETGSWSSPEGVTDGEFAKFREVASEYVHETQRQLDEFVRFQGVAGAASPGSEPDRWCPASECADEVEIGQSRQ